MLSKLLGTQVPEAYKRAHPTPAARLLGRLSRFVSETLWGRLTPTPLKRLFGYLGGLWSDYEWGWAIVAEEQEERRKRGKHRRNHIMVDDVTIDPAAVGVERRHLGLQLHRDQDHDDI